MSYYVGAVNPADLIGTSTLSTSASRSDDGHVRHGQSAVPAHYAITAVYGGDTNFDGSTGTLTQTVNPATRRPRRARSRPPAP